uniref:aminodeoxychorismate synthase n=1 Tax=Hyaloperonospora arabidopsidis (strain Emoy2) TaxID=559515 RepID=M4BFC6_HYAAE
MVASMDDVSAPAATEVNAAAAKLPRRVVSLLIDNYDSYTYNIMQMVAQVNGGDSSSVTVIKNDDFGGHFAAAWDHFVNQTSAITEEERVEIVRNVIISPGPGHPDKQTDFGMCADAIRFAVVPVLGVCLGHQGLAQVYGGRVVRAEEVMHGRTSRVYVHEKKKSLFAHVPDRFEAVRYHSLVIDSTTVPGDLEVIAKTDDGVIMAVCHRTKQQFGVQFHPEAVCSAYGYQLFQNFRDITLGQGASKCELHHRNNGRKNDTAQSQGMRMAIPLASTHRVAIQRAFRGLASLEFAEYVFTELFGDSKRSFWLDSSNHDVVAGTEAAIQSRCSMMGDDSGPLSYCVEYDVVKVELRVRRRQMNADDEQVEILQGQDMLTHIREMMRKHCCHEILIKESEERDLSVSAELPFAFRGGFVGYIGYEVLGSEREGTKQFDNDSGEEVRYECAPDASFLFADRTLVFDHLDDVIYSLTLSESDAKSANASNDWHQAMKKRLEQCANTFCQMSDARSPLSEDVGIAKSDVIFCPSRTRAQYVAAIDEIQRLIREGETYEVCLTNHLHAEYALLDPLAFYRMLRQRNPAPYAGFYLSNPNNRFQTLAQSDASKGLDGMDDTYAVCCSSPERYLRMGADGLMESKPIKGTRRRGHDGVEDAAIAEELATCEKDRAENMMIADLVRNDFGAVALVGSVHVPRLMDVETYATVHQLVTTVRAQRREDIDIVDVLRATFPGGSMTGAPKKRTLQIIRELERGPRGVYSGGLGFLSIDGSCDLNMIIRTAIVTPTKVTLGAGGAIVALSDSEKEYDEMLLKAQALVAAIGAYATGKNTGVGARVVVE